MFRFELKRCMKGRGFKAAFLISLILAAGHFTAFCICFLHNEYGGIITDKEAVKLLKAGQSVLGIYPANIFEGFIGGEQYTFWNGVYFYLLPIIAVLPFGTSFFEDEDSGYLKNIYIKKKKEIYLVCKFIVTFISGGIAAGLPYVFSFMMNLLYVPAIKPNQLARHNFVNQLNNMSDWYYEKTFLYFGVYLLIIMLCGGVFATLSLCVSFAAKNSLFVMFFPFLFNISFDYVAMELKIEKYVPSNIMNPMMTEYIKGRSMFSVFAEIFAAILLCFGFFVVLNKKRERIV